MSKGEGNPFDNYLIKQKIGEGYYGEVWKAVQKDTGYVCALKKIKKKESLTLEDENEIFNEINMLKKIDHPNIIKIFEFYNTSDAYYIAMEYCEGGELFEEIMKKAPFTEEYSAYIMYQVISALFYCHSLNIIHRDIKPENILIERKEDKILRVKICDLGSATIFSRGHYERKIVGSSYYIAPEVLKKNYNEKCDVWSCGVILYILLSGEPPFPGDSDSEIIENVMVGMYYLNKSPWFNVSKDAKNLIDKMLKYSPYNRISMSDALNHIWFKKFKIKEKLNTILLKPEDDKLIENFLCNIKNYKNMNPLQVVTYAYLIHNMPQLEQIENAYKLFNRIDLNGDGRISKAELFAGLKYFYYTKFNSEQITEDELNKIFENIDTNYNDEIEFEEFARAAIDKRIFIRDEFLRFAFKYFDKDRSGFVDIDELRQVFLQEKEPEKRIILIEKQLQDIFVKVDTNGDGKISYEEFKDMMQNIFM